MSHGDADAGSLTPQSAFYDQGRVGRLFPTLPPFASDTPLVRDALTELGAPGGPMDPADDLSDPVTLITDPAKNVKELAEKREPRRHGRVIGVVDNVSALSGEAQPSG